MHTTAFKLWFGFLIAAFAAAVFIGYTTGGTETGPLTLGWKGAVGNHIAYGIFVMVAAASGLLALTAQSFRDADAEAAAEILQVDIEDVPEAQISTGASMWPLFTALSVATMGVGLVAHPLVFGIGLIVMAVIAIEWTMTNWSERATGDPDKNNELREGLLRPIEIPVLGLVGIGVLVVAVSRILLAASVLGAVWIATVVGTVIFVTAYFISQRPTIPRAVVQGILALGFVAIIGWGIVAAINGERDFHHHGGEHGDSHVEEDH